MFEHWQLQDAKNRFSEVVQKALKDGPQFVTKHGVETVVIMSVERYRQLAQPRKPLVDFFRESPLARADLDLERNRDLAREVDF
ncbi:MAG: type II toxin-antitoxin system Phd/YefM family antitoxin [Desulfatitalea sp.]